MPPPSSRAAPIGGQTFLRFLLVGGSATALHYALMAALLATGMAGAGAASAIGYTLSTFYNYAANARFTFGGGHDHRRSLPRFLLTALAGLGINQILLLGLIRLGLPVPAAQLCATAGVLLWNYLVNALWSFKRPS
ncbi:MAG: GtrA family protein [Candidatus Dactylopiibacterium sp.]|nr:GtrA family protein [Candidatus Dactylopiibacterium sp.]